MSERAVERDGLFWLATQEREIEGELSGQNGIRCHMSLPDWTISNRKSSVYNSTPKSKPL